MPDRSHLIRDTTIDVNGHPKTVYRTPGSPATLEDSRAGKIGAPVSSRLVSTEPIHTQEFSLGTGGFDERWIEANRVKYAQDYIDMYKESGEEIQPNANGTFGALVGDDGITYFVDPDTQDLVLTAVPADHYHAAIATSPVIKSNDEGYDVTYMVGDEEDEDNHTVSFQIDKNGDYTDKPATLNTFENNLAAEEHLEALRNA
jgi:hypothetical protein